MTHPHHDLDDRIHTPVRFSLMAALTAASEVAFQELRDTLEVSESLLSQHIRVLEDAGYVAVRKAMSRKRVRTWLSVTPRGSEAFERHCATLRAIISATVADTGSNKRTR